MKVLFSFLICILFCITLNAQNFFKPIPKFTKQRSNVPNRAVIGNAVALNGDSTFWSIRPIASAVTLYIDGDVQAAAGGGISYQNITQSATTGRNYVNYAASFVILAGGAVNSNANSGDIEKFALFISALNNTVGLGYGLSRQEDPVTFKRKWKGGLAVVWTYNFNN